MQSLRDNGYHLNFLFGNLIYDLSTNEIIDCGEQGEDFLANDMMLILQKVYENNGKMLIIFTDKKYAVFTNQYHIAIYFSHNKKVRPISLYQTNQHKENCKGE